MRVAGEEGRIGLALSQADSEHAAVIPHGMAGVGAQIHDDLVNLGRVAKDGGGRFVDFHLKIDGGGEGRAEQALSVIDKRIQFAQAAFLFAAAAEGEDLADEGARAGFKSAGEFLPHGRVGGGLELDELQVAEDGGEDVVES